MIKSHTRRGFTLIEVLVVVLIIAVLAAIALPQYQKAVLKSRFAALMPIAKTLAESNEAYFLEHGNYAENPQALPVQGQESYPDGTNVELEDSADYSYVLASNATGKNNYIVYQKHSGKFANNIHCEALEDDAQANEICTSLGGTPISGSLTDGYATYVLSGTHGENDKLPSSLTKLAANLEATLCAGKTNCSATVKEDEVVVSDCGSSIQYKPSPSATIPSTGAGCAKTAYDSNGTETGKIFTICGSTHSNGICYPHGNSHRYETDFNSNGRIVADKTCLTMGTEGCMSIQVRTCKNAMGCMQNTAISEWNTSFINCGGQIVNLQTFQCE